MFQFNAVVMALLLMSSASATTVSRMGSLNGIRKSWADSYSIGGKCYCHSNFDHNIGPVLVKVKGVSMTVLKACKLIGNGPMTIGKEKRKYYNDIQCGNGPPNDAWDETACPGRVDLGRGVSTGCKQKGPKFPGRARSRKFIDGIFVVDVNTKKTIRVAIFGTTVIPKSFGRGGRTILVKAGGVRKIAFKYSGSKRAEVQAPFVLPGKSAFILGPNKGTVKIRVIGTFASGAKKFAKFTLVL